MYKYHIILYTIHIVKKNRNDKKNFKDRKNEKHHEK